jgi:hypothetical protein
MNLYTVTCVSTVAGTEKTLDVYVLATDPTRAAEAAIQAMHDADYSYTDYVKRVVLIASSDIYKAEAWLIGAK